MKIEKLKSRTFFRCHEKEQDMFEQVWFVGVNEMFFHSFYASASTIIDFHVALNYLLS